MGKRDGKTDGSCEAVFFSQRNGTNHSVGLCVLVLPETNCSPLKIVGWKIIFSFRGPACFQGLGYVAFREGTSGFPSPCLGGGFNDFLFSHLFGEMIQFDGHIFQVG